MSCRHPNGYEVETVGGDRSIAKLSCRLCGHVKWSGCRIMRRVLVKHSTLNLTTGVDTFVREEVVVQLCAIPLFDDAHARTGICRSCSQGWEVDGNQFATVADRELATGKQSSAIRAQEGPKE